MGVIELKLAGRTHMTVVVVLMVVKSYSMCGGGVAVVRVRWWW